MCQTQRPLHVVFQRGPPAVSLTIGFAGLSVSFAASLSGVVAGFASATVFSEGFSCDAGFAALGATDASVVILSFSAILSFSSAIVDWFFGYSLDNACRPTDGEPNDCASTDGGPEGFVAFTDIASGSGTACTAGVACETGVDLTVSGFRFAGFDVVRARSAAAAST